LQHLAGAQRADDLRGRAGILPEIHGIDDRHEHALSMAVGMLGVDVALASTGVGVTASVTVGRTRVGVAVG
jgi:hypothetical protein